MTGILAYAILTFIDYKCERNGNVLFNSIDFLIFFPIVVLLCLVLPKRVRYLWLLAASYYFYMCWEARYIFLLLAVTLCTYLGGLLLSWVKRNGLRKLVVAACAAVNLGLLFYFKYFEWFLYVCNSVLKRFHIYLREGNLGIILPVGISFYIFQSLGYVIDVYREKVTPEKNPFRYALFIAFFPQLVAGPIERSGNLLGQLKELDGKKLLKEGRVASGLTLMVWGLFVKMVIADRVAILVDRVFGEFYLCGTVALAAGALGFALQIYCDFMGYSTVAVGAARVLGIQLMENFDTPYFSLSVSQFWKRWHISLSTWFRDYVYIPLGGNRCSRLRKYLNVMITMGISGLWHGASWNYVAWGLLHGVYQVVGDLTGPLRRKLYQAGNWKTESFSFKLGQAVSTFLFVDLAWIFFRAGSVGVALAYYKRLFTKWDPWSLFNGEIYTLGLDRQEFHVLAAAVLALFLIELVRFLKKQTIDVFLQEQCLLFRWGVIMALVLAVMVYGIYGIKFESAQFIYFQF